MTQQPFEPASSGPKSPTDASSAKDQAADAAQAGKQAAVDVASTAADAAKDVASQTGAQARDLMGKTRTQLREQVVTQQGAVIESLRSLGDQLAEMTDDVAQQGTAVDVASQARDRVRRAADWLDGRDPDDVLDELRKVGRNRPGAFMLTAALAGVVAGRLTRGAVAVHTDADAPGAHRAGSDPALPAGEINRPTPGSIDPVVPR